MRNTGIFFIVSIVLHIVLFVFFFGWTLDTGRPRPAIYEVSIVSPMPLAPQARPAASKSAQVSRPKGRSEGFGEITKEQAIDRKAPSLKPVDLSSRYKPGEESEPPTRESITKDTAEPAVSAQAVAAAADSWGNRVRMLIQNQWRPPQGVRLDKGLQATFSIRISRTGRLISKSLVVSSRNAPYDRSIEIAMNKIQSFPAPPRFLIGGELYQDVLVTFTPPAEF